MRKKTNQPKDSAGGNLPKHLTTRPFILDGMAAPTEEEMRAYKLAAALLLQRPDWYGLPFESVEPTSYWHHDEDFAAFMDAVLVEVDLG